jgi:DNA polymerase-3 subunit beta
MPKIFIAQENLHRAVSVAEKFVSPKAPLPILSGILFEYDSGLLSAQGTDLDASATARVPASSPDEGTFRFVLPAKLLADLVARLPKADLEIDVDPEKLSAAVLYPGGKADISGFDPDSFPEFGAGGAPPDGFSLPQKELKSLNDRTAYAASADRSRPVFTAVCLEFGESFLSAVATDTRRLAFARCPAENLPGSGSALVPAQFLKKAASLMKEGEVELIIGGNFVAFDLGDVKLQTRTVAGQFPDWRQIVPSGGSALMSASSAALLAALERAALFLDPETPVISLDLIPDTGIRVRSLQQRGGFDETVPAEVAGERMSLFFKADYLREALQACAGEKPVRGEFSGPLQAAVFYPEGERENTLALVLPARLKS